MVRVWLGDRSVTVGCCIGRGTEEVACAMDGTGSFDSRKVFY